MIAVLLVLLAVALSTLGLLFRIVRASNKRRLLAGARGPSSDAPDGIGISVLCCGTPDLQRIENLLAVEYARYEVVVSVDSRLHPAEFAELLARYRIIRVEYVPTQELPVRGVRGLGRSRKRSFRRLVVVDREQDTPAGDFDAAASVAAYDYVLPLREGQSLMQGAVERLVAEVGEFAPGDVALVRSRLGEPVTLFGREAVVAAGGFTCRPVRRIPARNRRTLWEPLCTSLRPSQPVARPVRACAVLLLTVGICYAVVSGYGLLAATLLTAAMVWAAAAYMKQAFAWDAEAQSAGLFGRRRRGRKFGVKNFTIS